MMGNFGEVMNLDLTGEDENDSPRFFVGDKSYKMESDSMMRAARNKDTPINWLKIAFHEHSTYSFYTETPTGNFPDIYYSVTKKEHSFHYQDCAALPVELELDALSVVQDLPVSYGAKVKITCDDRDRFELKGDTLITCNEGTNFSYTAKPWCISDWSKFEFAGGVSGLLAFHPREEALQFGFQEEFLSGSGFTMVIDLINDREDQKGKYSALATVKLTSKLDLLTIEGSIIDDPNSDWTIHDPTIVLQRGIRKRRQIPHLGESLKLDLTSDNIYWVGDQASIPFFEKLNSRQFTNFQKFTNLTHGIPVKRVNWIRLSFIPDGNPRNSQQFYYTVTKKECNSIPEGIKTDMVAPVSFDTVVGYSCKPWYEPSLEDGQLKCR